MTPKTDSTVCLRIVGLLKVVAAADLHDPAFGIGEVVLFFVRRRFGRGFGFPVARLFVLALFLVGRSFPAP